MKIHYLLLGLGALGSISHSFAAPTSPLLPQPTPCIHAAYTASGSQHWKNITLTLTNNCEQVVDFQNSTITFQTHTPLNTSFWGDFGSMSYPDNTLNIVSSPDEEGKYHATLQLHFPEQPWANSKLPVHGSIKLKYGAEVDSHIEDTTNVFLGGLISTGRIELQNAARPESVRANYSVIHLTMNGKNITDIRLPWESSQLVSGLSSGTYQLNPESIKDSFGNLYQGSANPNVIEVKPGETAHSVLKYTLAESYGKVSIHTSQLPSELSGYTSKPEIVLTESQTGSSRTVAVEWESSNSIDQLIAGTEYNLTTPVINYNGYACAPTLNPSALKANAHTPPLSTLSYQCSQVGQDEVSLSVQGAPSEKTSLKLRFTPSDGSEAVKREIALNNGTGSASVTLSHNGIYTVSAEAIPGYRADFSPQPLVAAADAVETIRFSPIEPSKGRIIGYLTGWKTPPNAATLAAAGYTHVVVAFGVFSTSNPGAITPAMDTISKDYIASLHQNGIKVLLSLGGASSSIADTTVNFHEALSLAANPEQFQREFVTSLKSLLSEYGFDGFDIDIEHGLNGEGSFTSPQGDVLVMANIINTLHAQAPDLLITMAPQTANIGATSGFDETWGNYASLIMQTHDALTWVGIQLYNSGCIFGIDQICYQVTDNPDFSVAMATDLLENWPATLANGTPTGFQPYISYLKPSQVVLGYLAPNSSGAGDGSPIIPITAIKRSIQCLRTAVAGNSSCADYVPPKAYNDIGGVFNWEISFDENNQFNFAKELKSCILNNQCD